MRFGKNRRGIHSAVTAVNHPTPPPKVEVNQQATSWLGPLIVAVLSVPAAFILLWYALVFLAAKYGSRHPEKAVIDILIGLSILTIIILIAKILFDGFIDKRYHHLERMAEHQIEMIRLQQRRIQQLPPQTAHRMTDEQKKLYQIIMSVMDAAYKEIDYDSGKLRGKSQPWSKRRVGAIQLDDEPTVVGADSIWPARVKEYLMINEILLNDTTVNLTAYKDIYAIERRLNYDFGPLVRLSLPSPEPYKQIYSITD